MLLGWDQITSSSGKYSYLSILPDNNADNLAVLMLLLYFSFLSVSYYKLS